MFQIAFHKKQKGNKQQETNKYAINALVMLFVEGFVFFVDKY